jgi:hypothetical protein
VGTTRVVRVLDSRPRCHFMNIMMTPMQTIDSNGESP